MTMNQKEIRLLASLQESLKEFVKADIGKAARADLRALEDVRDDANRKIMALEKAVGRRRENPRREQAKR
jgi:hypothetical protein